MCCWDQLLHQGNMSSTLTYQFQRWLRCEFLDETLPICPCRFTAAGVWSNTTICSLALFMWWKQNVTRPSFVNFSCRAGPCWRRGVCPSPRFWAAPLPQRTNRAKRHAASKDPFGCRRILLKCDSVKHQYRPVLLPKWINGFESFFFNCRSFLTRTYRTKVWTHLFRLYLYYFQHCTYTLKTSYDQDMWIHVAINT